MKQEWTPQELFDHWMLTDTEMILINKHHADSNKLAIFEQPPGKVKQDKDFL